MPEDNKTQAVVEEISVVESAPSPTPEGEISVPKTAEEIYAEVMNEMYKTVAGVVHFLATNPNYGWIKTPEDVIFTASEFRIPDMPRPEAVGVLVVMGSRMIQQIREMLDGKRTKLEPSLVN